MKNKILIAALACLSVAAVAQQSASEQKPASTTSAAAPRDAATGKATGKTMAHDDWHANQATSVRESPSKGSLGVRESPSKASVMVRESPSKQSLGVSAGDVNGDGMPDKTASGHSNGSGQNAAINNSHSNIKSPRDSASGQASGKRQHQPVSVTKVSEDTPKK
jgi:hypothetical protein